MNRRGRRAAAVLCLAMLVTCGVATPALATRAAATTSSALAGESAHAALQSGPTAQANNSSDVRHENPDQSNEDGDLGAVEDHLARLLAERLSESAVRLNQNEYDRAQELLGDDFDERWEQYVDVAGEVGAERTAERFNRTRSTQREYAGTVEEFHATHREYQTAKRNGNDARARQLARRLARLSRQSNATASQLRGSYAELSNDTGANLTPASEAVTETQANVTTVERSVTDEELIRTRLSVGAASRTASFDDPLRLSGRLTTRNGTPVANEEIILDVAGRNHTVTTNDSGGFSLAYRPTTMPLSTTNVTVRYVPAGPSVYLGTNATVPASVEPVEGSLSITDAPDAAAFGDRVAVRGRLAVGNVGVPRYPVTVELGEGTLGTVSTDEEGRFELTTTLPAEIRDGSRRLRAVPGVRNRAVTAAPAAGTVDVRSTPTALTLAGQRVDGTDRRVRVDGTLRTEDGTPLAGRTVALRVDGATVADVRTDSDGSYRGAFRIPESAVDDGSANATVVAAFPGTGTSLEASRAAVDVTAAPTATRPDSVSEWVGGALDEAESKVDVPAGPPSGVAGLSALPWWIPVGAALAVVLLAGLGVGAYRRRGESEPSPEAATSTASDGSTPSAADAGGDDRSPLAGARNRLRSGDADGAVEMAYDRVRAGLATDLELPRRGTHWEFFAACAAALSPTRGESVRTQTEWYERAAYGREDVPESTAREAIDLAASLLDPEADDVDPATDGGACPGNSGDSGAAGDRSVSSDTGEVTDGDA